jgi:hypothetical protein
VPHILQRLSGPINAIIGDISGDKVPDIITVVSQEWEQVFGFVNDANGRFESRMLWGTTNSDFGSSWIEVVDFNRDGTLDIVYSNGDAFDYAPENSRPWHGVQWLKNIGSMRFQFQRIGDFSGASSPHAVDLDGDGDLDVVVVSAYGDWDQAATQSLIWFENDGQMRFASHDIANTPTHLITLASGDFNDDGQVDLVTGGMHISRPYNRMSRVTLWINHGTSSR